MAAVRALKSILFSTVGNVSQECMSLPAGGRVGLPIVK